MGHYPMPLRRALGNNGERIVAAAPGERNGEKYDSVGYATTPMDQRWRNHEFDLPEGSCVYFFTDGVTDQLGGKKGIAFGKRRIRESLQQNAALPMPEQRSALMQTFYAYQGHHARKDDVAAIGFRI